MSRTTSPLDALVKRVSKKSIPAQGETRIVFEEKSRIVLEKEPVFWGAWGKRIARFDISTHPVKSDGFTYSLAAGVGFKISYQANCPSGNEALVVTALHKPNTHPEEVLHQILKKHIREYLQYNELALLVQHPEQFADFLAERILEETGLAILPEIKLNEAMLKPFPVEVKTFRVRVQDYDDTVNISFSTELVVNKYAVDQAIKRFSNLDSTPRRLEELVKNTMASRFVLNDLYHELSAKVKTVLIDEINKYLLPEGRQVVFLDIRLDADILPVNTLRYEIEHVDKYKIADYNGQVSVLSTLVLQLHDITACKNHQKKAGYSDFKTWFTTQAIALQTKEVLFEKTYKTVLLETDTVRKEIQDRISEVAAAAGYKIRQHTFLPELRQLKLQHEGFSVKTGPQIYFTEDSRVSVKIDVTVRGFIKDLSELPDRMLLPDADIEEEMKLGVITVVEETMHVIGPEHFFMYFKGDTELDYQPVDVNIKKSITAYLEDHFHVDNSSMRFIINPMENEVSVKAAGLTNKQHWVNVVLLPTLDSPYVEEITFSFLFRVLGVMKDGWPVFQSNIRKTADAEIEEIKTVLQVTLHQHLTSIRYSELMSNNFKIKDAIRKNILNKLFADISQKFGLALDLFDYKRQVTKSEKQAVLSLETKIAKEEDNKRRVLTTEIEKNNELLETLYNKRKLFIEHEQYDEARDVEKEIEQLKAVYPTSMLRTEQDIRKLTDYSDQHEAPPSLLDDIMEKKQKKLEQKKKKGGDDEEMIEV
jgi:hypothetical protein